MYLVNGNKKFGTLKFFQVMTDKSDVVFRDVFYVLDNEMKRCILEGLGVVRLATPVSLSIKEKMWHSGKLGEEKGKQLVETLLYLLGENAGLRGGLEHKKLQRGSITKLTSLRYVYTA